MFKFHLGVCLFQTRLRDRRLVYGVFNYTVPERVGELGNFLFQPRKGGAMGGNFNLGVAHFLRVPVGQVALYDVKIIGQRLGLVEECEKKRVNLFGADVDVV